jgi:hypothetical protein
LTVPWPENSPLRWRFRISISRGRTDDTASAARQVNLNKRTPPREPERAYLAIRHPAG